MAIERILVLGNGRLCPQYPVARVQSRVFAVPSVNWNGTSRVPYENCLMGVNWNGTPYPLRYQGRSAFPTKDGTKVSSAHVLLLKGRGMARIMPCSHKQNG